MQNKSTFEAHAAILFFLLPIFLHGQSPSNSLCDTLFLRDGQIIAAHIKTVEKNAIIYAICGDSALALSWISIADLTKVRYKSNRLFSYSVIPKDSSYLHHVYMLDGSRYTGSIIADNGEAITLVKENQTIVDLQRSKIKSILRLKRGEISGRSVLDRAVSSHYLMGANNFQLRQGEGYYQNGVLLFNQVRYGFTNYFSLNAGLFPLLLLEEKPVLFWVSPKFSYPVIKDRLYIGGSGLLSRVTGDGGETFGFYNGSVTYGSVRNNVTTGIGHLYLDEGWGKRPVFSLGFTLTPIQRISLVSETYGRRRRDTWGIINISGIRFYFKKATIDLAFLAISEDEDLTALPWFSLTFPFGGNK